MSVCLILAQQSFTPHCRGETTDHGSKPHPLYPHPPSTDAARAPGIQLLSSLQNPTDERLLPVRCPDGREITRHRFVTWRQRTTRPRKLPTRRVHSEGLESIPASPWFIPRAEQTLESAAGRKGAVACLRDVLRSGQDERGKVRLLRVD